MSDEREGPFTLIDPDINHFNRQYSENLSFNESSYYEVDHFNYKFEQTNNALKILHINIRSINQNGDSFLVFLSNLNVTFDVICISETWLVEEA